MAVYRTMCIQLLVMDSPFQQSNAQIYQSYIVSIARLLTYSVSQSVSHQSIYVSQSINQSVIQSVSQSSVNICQSVNLSVSHCVISSVLLVSVFFFVTF